ncbi:uncharacterized protein EI90DRAFT_3072421 [Cantharellus anzutake]|uniref:uncharacterized protein n=1 Tax=Cantharellus anzutake TaxID=1750568 RepID=UPI001906C144|nr:uncharacterized protein EI90DRAFT_3072421 [Cantharellus anzutake]KAF8325536.1 hypothetical protein EI90DRAFT_3072421 [Cantharellus anzutake]
MYLQRRPSTKKTGSTEPELPELETELECGARDGRVSALFMPFHINGNHFVAIKVDFQEKLLTYSDPKFPSLSCCPGKILHAVKGWLSLVSGTSGWNFQSREFPMPYQGDNTSCGVVVISSIAANVLGHEEWSIVTRFHHRLAWFLWITHPDADSVSIP